MHYFPFNFPPISPYNNQSYIPNFNLSSLCKLTDEYIIKEGCFVWKHFDRDFDEKGMLSEK